MHTHSDVSNASRYIEKTYATAIVLDQVETLEAVVLRHETRDTALVAELAIVATDLAELLGSGIALCLLFPSLPLWAGVLITASDVLVFLALKDPLGGRPARVFELVIAAMVFTVLVCMAVIISQVGVRWGRAFEGFLPSSTLFQSGGLYTCAHLFSSHPSILVV